MNESSVEVDIWVSSASENLGGIVNAVEVGAETKKLEDHKWVLVLASSYYFCMNLWNLIVFAFLQQGDDFSPVLGIPGF